MFKYVNDKRFQNIVSQMLIERYYLIKVTKNSLKSSKNYTKMILA